MGQEAQNSGWAGGAVAAGVAAAVIGGIGTLATVWVTNKNHQADIDTKLIELSIGILQGEPKPGTESLRVWAISTLQTKGNVNFGDATQALKTNQLPPSASRSFLNQQQISPVK